MGLQQPPFNSRPWKAFLTSLSELHYIIAPSQSVPHDCCRAGDLLLPKFPTLTPTPEHYIHVNFHSLVGVSSGSPGLSLVALLGACASSLNSHEFEACKRSAPARLCDLLRTRRMGWDGMAHPGHRKTLAVILAVFAHFINQGSERNFLLTVCYLRTRFVSRAWHPLDTLSRWRARSVSVSVPLAGSVGEPAGG